MIRVLPCRHQSIWTELQMVLNVYELTDACFMFLCEVVLYGSTTLYYAQLQLSACRPMTHVHRCTEQPSAVCSSISKRQLKKSKQQQQEKGHESWPVWLLLDVLSVLVGFVHQLQSFSLFRLNPQCLFRLKVRTLTLKVFSGTPAVSATWTISQLQPYVYCVWLDETEKAVQNI